MNCTDAAPARLANFDPFRGHGHKFSTSYGAPRPTFTREPNPVCAGCGSTRISDYQKRRGLLVCMRCEDAGRVVRAKPAPVVETQQQAHHRLGRRLPSMRGVEFTPPSHDLSTREMGRAYTAIIETFLAGEDDMTWCQRVNGHHSDAIANRLNDRRRKGYPITVHVMGDRIYISRAELLSKGATK